MELLNFVGTDAFSNWIIRSLVLLFMVGGMTVLAAGMSLAFYSAGTLRFFTGLDRWISSRRAFRPMEAVHDTRQAVQRYRYWLAAFFIGGGVFAIFGLAMRIDAATVIVMFHLQFLPHPLALWMIESARWILITGNMAGIVAGVMLGFYPDALIALEARGAHWYSDRTFAKGADTMYLAFDKWVAAYPRAFGWTISIFAVGMIGTYGLMLPRMFN